MSQAKSIFAVVLTAIVWSSTAFGNTYVKVADEWGTIKQAGARPANNGNRFWNIEGAATTFGDTGTLRFYTADLISKLNTDFGVNNWKIDDISLVLQHSDAAFSTPGNVSVFLFSNDALAITNGSDSNGGVDMPPGNF